MERRAERRCRLHWRWLRLTALDPYRPLAEREQGRPGFCRDGLGRVAEVSSMEDAVAEGHLDRRLVGRTAGRCHERCQFGQSALPCCNGVPCNELREDVPRLGEK